MTNFAASEKDPARPLLGGLVVKGEIYSSDTACIGLEQALFGLFLVVFRLKCFVVPENYCDSPISLFLMKSSTRSLLIEFVFL